MIAGIVENLTKEYMVPTKAGWFRKKYISQKAINEISFSIERGKIVGLIGPNGAGKSTTIKILSGILTPTKGKVEIFGFIPWKQRYEYTNHIGVIMGQKDILEWDIPVIESLKLYRDIYQVHQNDFTKNVEFMGELLQVSHLLHVPVRKLSLGERRKCELIASLLHRPKIVFLDEPCIGLDIIAKENLRKFIQELNNRDGITFLISTHDMHDIEELCDDVIILKQGKIVFNDTMDTIKNIPDFKIVQLEYKRINNREMFEKILGKVNIISHQDNTCTFEVSSNKITSVVAVLLNCTEIVDLDIRLPDIETIIRNLI